MQIAPLAPTLPQLHTQFQALRTHADQLGALAKDATTVTPQLLQSAKATFDLADAASIGAVSFASDQRMGPAVQQAREGIEAMLDRGDSARETLAEGFDPAAILDLRRAAQGLHGISTMMLLTIDEAIAKG